MKKLAALGLVLFAIGASGEDRLGNELRDVVSLGEVFDYSGVVYFETNGAKISDNDERVLRRAAEALQENPKATLTIVGHTDSRGGNKFNMGLSQRRAESVKRYLIAKYKVGASRIKTVGRGEDQPVASNDDDGGRAKNRRVDINITNPGTPNVGTSYPDTNDGKNPMKNVDKSKPNVGTSYPENKEAMKDRSNQNPNVGASTPAQTEAGRRDKRGTY